MLSPSHNAMPQRLSSFLQIQCNNLNTSYVKRQSLKMSQFDSRKYCKSLICSSHQAHDFDGYFCPSTRFFLPDILVEWVLLTTSMYSLIHSPLALSVRDAGALIQFSLEATNAAPNEAALPTKSTRPITAQFTFGNCNTGNPPTLIRYRPDDADSMPAIMRPSILNIIQLFAFANNKIQAKNY